MSMRWAIINLDTNVVDNVIIWDGNSYMFPYPVEALVQLSDDERCGPGFIYDASGNPRFSEPEPIQEPV